MLPRQLLLPLCALLLTACSSALNPRTRVAKASSTAGPLAHLRDKEMVQALSAAALAADRGQVQQEQYNVAVGKFLRALQEEVSPRDWSQPLRVTSAERDWLVSFEPKGAFTARHNEWAPSWFERVIPASECKSSKCENPVTGTGLGATVVLANEDMDELAKQASFRPRTGLYVPATAVLEFGRAESPEAPLPVRLRLYNTIENRRARYGAEEVALAYDVTASLMMSLENRDILKNALGGLLRPDKSVEHAGVFGFTAYDPKKIPVVFVHGLKSDPHIWRNIINEIFYDPELAARYQPVCYMYPSGLSVPASSLRLRQSLRAYRDLWDPDHNDPGMTQMLLVGHSMGGIVSRMQVIDSGEDLRKAFFTRPIEEVPFLTDRQAAQVKEALVFEHQPNVKRAVFVAVPHKGSEMADLSIVRFAIRLIRLPADALGVAKGALTQDTGMLNPALLNYNMLGLRSVDMLSPEHPYFKAIQQRPILVPYHSIIGDRRRGDTPDSSDGVVPYWSSHLEGAQSELIVPWGHSCVEKPETVQEMLRILRLHAGVKK